MANKTVRVITRGADGELKTRDYDSFEEINRLHEQVGIDDCSTDLSLRGMPVFRGLVGPMPESKSAVRYESPEVFESLTKEWTSSKIKRRRRRKKAEIEADNAAAEAAIAEQIAIEAEAKIFAESATIQ